MSELAELEDELQRLKSLPRAMSALGRDGKIIGIIRETVGDVNAGMVVLFSNPPPKDGMEVMLTAYQVRDSKTSGKKYVKCFQWTEASVLEKTIKELEEKIEELKKIEKETELQRIREQNLQALSQLGLGEEALKLLEARQYEAFATLLIKSGARAVLWWDKYFLVIDKNKRFIEITEKFVIEIKEVELPIHFSKPMGWFTSEDMEIVPVDTEIKSESAIVLTTWESLLLVSKKIAEKIQKIRDSKLDQDMKNKLYAMILR